MPVSGQKLRWWQEEEQPRPAYVAPPPVAAAAESVPVELAETAAEFRDVGEELEAEALRRAEEAKRLEAASLVFRTDPARAKPLFRRRLAPSQRFTKAGTVVVAAWLAMAWTFVALSGHIGAFTLLPLAISVASLLLPLMTPRLIFRFTDLKAADALTLRPEGISVGLPDVRNWGVIPWSHIADVRVVRPCRLREEGADLLIVLRDQEEFARSLKPEEAKRFRQYMRIVPASRNQPLARWVNGGEKVSQGILVPDFRLPIEPEAVVARIAAYEAGHAEKAPFLGK